MNINIDSFRQLEGKNIRVVCFETEDGPQIHFISTDAIYKLIDDSVLLSKTEEGS